MVEAKGHVERVGERKKWERGRRLSVPVSPLGKGGTVEHGREGGRLGEQ